MPTAPIVLTDYPKKKWIEANYRGMETESLLAWRRKLFMFMMQSMSEVAVGGWVINIDRAGVEAELIWRKVELELL